MIQTQKPAKIHSFAIRLFHWLNAIAVVLMLGSGLQIYNASPLFGFSFPQEITLGKWLGGALQLHFTAMWLLMINFAVYLILGSLSGRLKRMFFPLKLADILAVTRQTLGLKLEHEPGRYNALQRLLFVAVLMAMLLTILSGFAVWKPVQLRGLASLMGGYEAARYVHFTGMALVAAFTVIHLAMAVVFPSSLRAMITGSAHDANKGAHNV